MLWQSPRDAPRSLESLSYERRRRRKNSISIKKNSLLIPTEYELEVKKVCGTYIDEAEESELKEEGAGNLSCFKVLSLRASRIRLQK